MKPVLFVTNLVAPDRVGAFTALSARGPLELALFGGRSHHATGAVAEPGVPHTYVAQREIAALAAGHSAVVCGTAGRVALPAAYRGARRAGVPFVLWTALWEHPRTPAHLLAGGPLLKRLYKRANAIVTYGPHVSAFARDHGARNVHIAPQAVDNEFWSAAVPAAPARPFRFVFAGRAARYKGVPELLEAWRASELARHGAELLLVGPHDAAGTPGVEVIQHAEAPELRNIYASSDVLVMPAVSTRAIREPWGLVANEAMNQKCAVIASDAVGAAAGGLIRDNHNGLVVPQSDIAALAEAMRRLEADRPLSVRLGKQGAFDVTAYSYEAWADGFCAALKSAGVAEWGDC